MEERKGTIVRTTVYFLAAEGMKQKDLTFFEDKNISVLYTSMEKSSTELMRAFAREKKLPIYVVEEFREAMGYEEKQWDDFNLCGKSGESFFEVQDRMIDGLALLVNQEEGKNIVVASHEIAICMAIHFFDETYGYRDYQNAKNSKIRIVKFSFEGETCIEIEEIKAI